MLLPLLNTPPKSHTNPPKIRFLCAGTLVDLPDIATRPECVIDKNPETLEEKGELGEDDDWRRLVDEEDGAKGKASSQPRACLHTLIIHQFLHSLIPFTYNITSADGYGSPHGIGY
ncbi:hypothetical protein AX15_006967 [Amanita polypyramis BW_CC]|nr:hypothetical protein AX15_006967 [Amanita polypyramis BW_CC]